MTWLLVFAFGGLGAVARVGLATWLPVRELPWATFGVNAVGCLLIGVAYSWFEARGQPMDLAWRVALVGGFLGGFTTFSAFGLETWVFLRQGQAVLAIAYAAGSVLLGIAAVVAGVVIGRELA